jgi:hypothetical protein
MSTTRARHLAAGLAGVGAALLLLAAGPALGTPEVDGAHTVTICHRTASDSNPYVEDEVDVASILDAHGHGGHTGPVWVESHPKHEDWGDIVPAFDLGPGEQFAGLNALDGAAILAGRCAIPGATTTSSTAASTTSTTEATTSSTSVSTTAEPTTTSSALEGVQGASGSTSSSAEPSSTTTSSPEESTTTQVTAIDPAHGSTSTELTVVADGGGGLPRTGLDAGLLASLGAALVLASLGTLGFGRRARGA